MVNKKQLIIPSAMKIGSCHGNNDNLLIKNIYENKYFLDI